MTTQLEGKGFIDLIAGITPELSDWSVDPTDANHLTDGDITTHCETGNKVITAGWQKAYITWTFDKMYDVLLTGVGKISSTAPSGFLFPYFFDGTNWVVGFSHVLTGETEKVMAIYGGKCSKIRFGVTGSAAGTITPSIRELHAWRV